MADPDISSVIETPFDAALSERYLVYALSTITARSLPDVRDGLKPVHRRLLWAMRLLRLDPAGAYKKSARVVGDVIGKYHPHGDQSVYDAMVRLAQDFALRYPLVDGQGNFGNIDGDNAAAYRYTEARLTAVAMQLMAGLDEGTVDFKPTYNGEEEEPEVFPGLFPNLLANGASGIAVGMATSIPPHNLTELIDAAVELIDNPKARRPRADAVGQGPRFPDRRSAGRRRGHDRPRLRQRARRLPAARAKSTVEREKGGRLALAGQRNPVRGAESQADRADRAAHRRQEAAHSGRRQGRKRGGSAGRARAARPHRRSRFAAREPLPPDRPRNPLPAQPQRARRDPHSGRDEPQGSAARLARFPDRRPAQPLAHPHRQDRRPHRAARRLPRSPSSTSTASSRSSAARTSPSRC